MSPAKLVGPMAFMDAAQREKLLERQAMEAAKTRVNDRMEEVASVSPRSASLLLACESRYFYANHL